MFRADMIGPRRLRPATQAQPTISFVLPEARPLQGVADPVTTRGTMNGIVPACRPPCLPQPALVLRDDLAKSQAAGLLDDMISKADGKKSDDWISDKIRLLMHEGKKQDQAIAIAYSMAGRSHKK